MGLGTLLGGQALRELLRFSPQIISTAEQVFTTVKRNRQKGAEVESTLTARLAALEAADVAQAELLEKMAGQIQAVTGALDAVTSRLRLVTALAVGSLAVSALLFLALLLTR